MLGGGVLRAYERFIYSRKTVYDNDGILELGKLRRVYLLYSA